MNSASAAPVHRPTAHTAPVLANAGSGALTYSAGSPPEEVTATLTVSSSDATTLAGATVRISSGLVAGSDSLGFTGQDGIRGSYSSRTGVLTLTGTASLAGYQAALRSVTYRDSNAKARASSRTVSFQVNDGSSLHNLSNVVSRRVNVTTATTHTAPVLSDVETTPLSYQVGGAPLPVTSTLTVADSDDSTLSRATVSVTSGFDSGADTLSFTNEDGITGSYNSSTGVLTLSGDATVALYQIALRSVTFSTTDPSASQAARTVSFVVTDTNGETSNTASRTVDVTTVPPVLANVETTPLSYQVGGAPLPVTSTLTVADSDDSTMSGATVSITSGFDSGADTLSFTNEDGITGSYNTATGVLTLSGDATVALYQIALQSVTFSTTDTSASQAARTVSFVVTDTNGETSNTASRMIDVTAAS